MAYRLNDMGDGMNKLSEIRERFPEIRRITDEQRDPYQQGLADKIEYLLTGMEEAREILSNADYGYEVDFEANKAWLSKYKGEETRSGNELWAEDKNHD